MIGIREEEEWVASRGFGVMRWMRMERRMGADR